MGLKIISLLASRNTPYVATCHTALNQYACLKLHETASVYMELPTHVVLVIRHAGHMLGATKHAESTRKWLAKWKSPQRRYRPFCRTL